jgi:RNA polymerase sigma factor (sigma-70 family)
MHGGPGSLRPIDPVLSDMENPLASGDPDLWARVVDAVNPASLMVVISERLGPDLRRVIAPEDILQDTLAKAWRARTTFEWQGLQSFRRWLLRIAERCVEDERDRARSERRGGGHVMSLHRPSRGSGESSDDIEPWSSTTPSRIAVARERMRAMNEALISLPDEVREVVRLRLFEDLMLEEIADRLTLGLSAIRHRFRKGAELYRQRLRVALGVTERAAAGGSAGIDEIRDQGEDALR